MTPARGFFITGTNTDVGKTVVARAVTTALVRMGVRAVAVKPVESGVENVPTDAAALSRVSHSAVEAGDVTLYAFKAPISPHAAAQREGRTIEKSEIISFLEMWSNRAEILIAEGAGGLLVPLSSRYTYADVIAETELQVIIVAPDVLGTINATLLTIEAARARNMSIAGVVLNGTPEPGLGNREAISTHGAVTILGELPTLDDLTDDALADIAGKNIDLNRIVSLAGR